MRITRAILFVAAATVMWSGEASADKADAARESFKQGRDHFKAGEYVKAVDALQKAYALKPHPALLRFLGLTYYKMNKAKLAIAHFKRYLKEAPNAPDKDKVLAKVKELEMVVGATDDEDEPPPPAPAPAPPTPTPAGPTKTVAPPTGEDNEVPDSLDGRQVAKVGETDDGGGSSAMTVLKWIALGVGVGGIAAGGVFMGLAAGNASDLEAKVVESGNTDGKTPQEAYNRDHHDLQESFKKNRTIGIAAFVVGGVMAVGAGVLFLLDRSSGDERASASSNLAVAPVISGDVYGVAGQLRF